MDKLLLMGVSNDTKYALDYCKEIGVHTIVTDYIPYENSPEKHLADEYWMIDVKDIDALEKKCIEEGVTGVYAGNNEFCLDYTRLLAKRLGLPFYASDEGWACARDKVRFKEHCIAAGLDVPKRYSLSLPLTKEMLDQIHYPVIVKPVDECASRGITICRSEAKLADAVNTALSFSRTGNILVEDFIEGTEAIAFFYFDEGEFHLLYLNVDVFDEPNPMLPTLCSGIVVKKREWSKQFDEQLGEKFQHLFAGMDCRNGIAYVQMKRKGEKYYPFEMGYRLDGLGDWILSNDLYGFNYLEAMVDLALGKKPRYSGESIVTTANGRQGVIYLILGKPGKVVYIEDEVIHNTEGVTAVKEGLSTGTELRAEGNMTQMAYYLTVTASNREELLRKIWKINGELIVLDETGTNLLFPFNSFDRLYDALETVNCVRNVI